ncbi:MAG TPA: hypothetical protein VFC73_07240 [Syntrophomonadaceae bacterium]|nr:hypothetical protein [Syntrophomonadaceae bacterium]
MGHKTWFNLTVLITSLSVLTIGMLNFYIDPLWCYGHVNEHNQVQMPFNERQQKTNYITFNEFDYDTLILGSSRITYIDQNDFKGHKAYNYSVSNMLLDEYHDYIEYAKKMRGSEFEHIIIGLDFMATNKNIPREFEMPSYYIDNTSQFAYRYKTLISTDTLDYSRQNYEAAQNGEPVNFAYDRSNIKTLLPVSAEERTKKIQATIDKYRQDIYSNYEYAEVKEILGQVKASNPNTNFIIFTTPVNHNLYKLMEEMDLSTHYQQLLIDTVEVFGQVYDFNYPNPITTDDSSYYDASHFYPEIGTLIANKVTNTGEIVENFGVLLTK